MQKHGRKHRNPGELISDSSKYIHDLFGPHCEIGKGYARPEDLPVTIPNVDHDIQEQQRPSDEGDILPNLVVAKGDHGGLSLHRLSRAQLLKPFEAVFVQRASGISPHQGQSFGNGHRLAVGASRGQRIEDVGSGQDAHF